MMVLSFLSLEVRVFVLLDIAWVSHIAFGDVGDSERSNGLRRS